MVDIVSRSFEQHMIRILGVRVSRPDVLFVLVKGNK